MSHGEAAALLIGVALLALVLALAGTVGWYEATRGSLVIGCPANGGLCGVGMRT